MAALRGILLALLAALALLPACRHTIVPPENLVAGLSGEGKVYTLTDLHAKDGGVSAANFQFKEVIPVCSEVTLLTAYDEYLEYWYRYHQAAGEPFDRHLARYFGRACPQTELDALTPEEREAVRRGVAQPGMRKEAVILALGYPPLRDTRTLELPVWRYWRTSLKSFLVVFGDDGKVETVH